MSIAAYRIRSTGQYPVSYTQLQQMFPNVSLPANLQQADFDHLGIDPVFVTPTPVVDAIHMVQEGVPTPISGGYQQVWTTVDITVGMTSPQLTALTAQLKASRLSDLANYRYAKETGGTVWNGSPILTDRESQAMINGANSLVTTAGGPTSVQFKTPAGFVTLTAAQVTALALTIGTHVQQCFINENTHTVGINSKTTPQDVIAYDFTTNWPV